MIGGDDDVGGGGKTEIVERLAQLRQIVVGIRMPASEVGPLMPGVTVLRLSP